MTLMPNPAKGEVGSSGPTNAKIAFIGEAPAADEVRKGIPFVGPAGSIYEHCLHAASLIRGQVYTTNLIKIRIKSIDKFFNQRTACLTNAGDYWRKRLADELRGVDANIIVPMGGPACAAVLGDGYRITSVRGYLAEALDIFNHRKCLPTMHPASALYGGSYINIHYISHDMMKAKQNSVNKEFDYRKMNLVFPRSFGDALRLLDIVATWSIVGFDTEVLNYEISFISFSDGCTSIAIPLGKMWSDEEETIIWRRIADILEREDTKKVIQNSIFDRYILLDRMKIAVRGEIDDTMMGHSIVYPDFKKSLAFLASIYDNVPYWKNMVHFDNIKEES